MARILIVDDAPILRKNLKTILTEAGHTIVAEASNGSQAYIEYVKHKPDLVTMDITMPFMNGLDTLKKIIGDYPNANIIIISSTNNNKVILEAIQNGAKNYIIKPFMVDKVLEVVNQVLEVNTKINTETITRIYQSIEQSDGKAFGDIEDMSPIIALAHTDIYDSSYFDEESTFTIQLRENIFHINISDKIDPLSFDILYGGIQGFLLVKPLRIIFDFGESKFLYNDFTDKIIEFSNKVIKIRGSIFIIAKEKLLVTAFKNRGISMDVKFYSDISDMVL